MDEAVKIYAPKVIERKEAGKRNLWKEVWLEQANKTHELEQKYPWVQIVFNWAIAIAAVIFVFSLILWAMSISASNKAAADYNAAVETFYREQAELKEQEEAAVLAAKNSEESRKARDIQLMAQFLEGISGFVDNWGYSTDDLYTYAQCPLNRVLNPAFACETLEEALLQKDQWVGFSEKNQVTAVNKNLATKIINEFYDGDARPCSYIYCWAELRKEGVWLKSDFEKASFNNTWRYRG